MEQTISRSKGCRAGWYCRSPCVSWLYGARCPEDERPESPRRARTGFALRRPYGSLKADFSPSGPGKAANDRGVKGITYRRCQVSLADPPGRPPMGSGQNGRGPRADGTDVLDAPDAPSAPGTDTGTDTDTRAQSLATCRSSVGRRRSAPGPPPPPQVGLPPAPAPVRPRPASPGAGHRHAGPVRALLLPHRHQRRPPTVNPRLRTTSGTDLSTGPPAALTCAGGSPPSATCGDRTIDAVPVGGLAETDVRHCRPRFTDGNLERDLLIVRDSRGNWARPVRRRPDVGQILRNSGEERCVRGRILAYQRRPVAAVKDVVTEPRRQFPRNGQQRLVTYRYTWAEREQVGDECGRTAVLMTVLTPHLADFQAIPDQRFLVSGPHPHCWMVAPPVTRDDKAAKDLQRLDTLFAQSATVQDQGRGPEVGIRQKGLHAVVPSAVRHPTRARRVPSRCHCHSW